VVIAIALSTLTIGGTIYGYVLCANRAEWSGYSLAANSLAMQRLEQARACRWDPLGYNRYNDELVQTNFPITTNNVLDMPVAGGNVVYATNITTITTMSTNPPLKMIRVDCIWAFRGNGPFTNTVVTYRAPDQ
jgi:hypothetical protein